MVDWVCSYGVVNCPECKRNGTGPNGGRVAEGVAAGYNDAVPAQWRRYLKTRYSDRLDVKALGARWDATRKAWYADSRTDLKPFLKWLSVAPKAPSAPKRSAPISLDALDADTPESARYIQLKADIAARQAEREAAKAKRNAAYRQAEREAMAWREANPVAPKATRPAPIVPSGEALRAEATREAGESVAPSPGGASWDELMGALAAASVATPSATVGGGAVAHDTVTAAPAMPLRGVHR